MNRKSLAIASAVVVALMLAAGAAVASSLPDGLQLPTHWGIDGRPDRFADKWSALLIPAAILAGVSLLLYFVPALESRREGLERSPGLYSASWIALLLMGPLIQLSVISTAYGWPVEGTTFILAGLGLTFVLIGNQLGKSRSMYLIGIRTPWTLASEEVWVKTHRLAGKLMVGAGLLTLVAALAMPSSEVLVSLLMALVIGTVLVPAVYSYLLWRAETRRDQPSA